jgi:hypothetical protein
MQKSFYVFIWENLNCQTYHYPNRLLVTIKFVTRCVQDYFIILFILCMQSSNNNKMTFCVATLTLDLWPKQRFARLRVKREVRGHTSCSRECKRMWVDEPSHSQGNSHLGTWSPGGLPNFQGMIVRVKTHWFKKFFISLERYWNVDV